MQNLVKTRAGNEKSLPSKDRQPCVQVPKHVEELKEQSSGHVGLGGSSEKRHTPAGVNQEAMEMYATKLVFQKL